MIARLLPRNENIADRLFRGYLGATLLSTVWIGPQTAWGWIGMIPLVTGLIGSCPAYTIFGVSTCADWRRRDT